MTNLFQLLLVSVIVVLTLLIVIVSVQVLAIIHDFRQLIKKIETTADLPKFHQDATSTAVKVKQFFHKK